MAASDLKVSLILKLVDQLTGPSRGAVSALQRIGAVTEQTGSKGVKWANEQLAANQARKSALLGEAFGVTAVAGAIGGALKPAIDFERSMAQVGAISRASDEDLARLTATARELGAKTPWAASEAADGMKFLSMAGFEVNETIAAMPGMLQLASAGSIDLGNAADIASNILTGFGMKADEMAYLGDVLTNTFTTSNTDLLMLGQTMKYVAPNAAALNVSIEQTAAMIGKLGDAGIQGTMAGTALRAMLTRLAALPKPASDALAELGVKTKDAAGNLRDMPTVLADINTAMEGYGSGEKAKLVADIFGLEAASAATVLLEQAGIGALQSYAESLTETGSAARIAARMNETTAGALKRLGSITESVAISVGSILLPEIVSMIETVIPLIDAIQSWAGAHPELISLVFRLTAGLLLFRLGSIATRFALFSLLTPILQFSRAGAWMLILLPRLARGLWALTSPLKVVRLALVALRMAFIASGIGALLAGVAMAGIWIYNNWEGLRTFFVGFWVTFREALGPAAPLIDGIIGGVRGLWDWLIRLLGPVEANEERWLSWGLRAGEALGGIVGRIGDWIGANESLSAGIGKVVVVGLGLRVIVALASRLVGVFRLMARLALANPLTATLTALGALALANPLTATLTALGALALAVYTNWDSLSAWLMEKIDAVKAAFDQGLLNGVFKLLAEFNPFTLAWEGAQSLIAYLMELAGVPAEIVAAFQGFSLYETGVQLITSLWEGMLSLIETVVGSIVSRLAALKPQWLSDLQNWAKGGETPELSKRVSEISKASDGAAPGPGGPFRDRGGPVRAGMPYIVGERHPEIFVPGVSGTILPGRVLKAAVAASALAAPGSASITPAEVIQNIDRRPALAAPAQAQQIIRQGDTITINITPAPGMSAGDVAREVKRVLAERESRRRADLHDEVDY